MVELKGLEPTVAILMELSTQKKFHREYELQKNITYLTSMHQHFSQKLQDRIHTLLPLAHRVKELESAVEDCTAQLKEVDYQVERSLNIRNIEDLEKSKKLEVRTMACVQQASLMIQNQQALIRTLKSFELIALVCFTQFLVQCC